MADRYHNTSGFFVDQEDNSSSLVMNNSFTEDRRRTGRQQGGRSTHASSAFGGPSSCIGGASQLLNLSNVDPNTPIATGAGPGGGASKQFSRNRPPAPPSAAASNQQQQQASNPHYSPIELSLYSSPSCSSPSFWSDDHQPRQPMARGTPRLATVLRHDQESNREGIDGAMEHRVDEDVEAQEVDWDSEYDTDELQQSFVNDERYDSEFQEQLDNYRYSLVLAKRKKTKATDTDRFGNGSNEKGSEQSPIRSFSEPAPLPPFHEQDLLLASGLAAMNLATQEVELCELPPIEPQSYEIPAVQSLMLE